MENKYYEDELHYLVFALGYDLLHHYLENNVYYTDSVYDVCNDIVKRFLDSDFYKENYGCKHSSFKLLSMWLRDNVITDKKCGRCGNDLLKSFADGYDYQCYSCCEDFYEYEIFVVDNEK